MARRCEICDRGPITRIKRSYSHKAIKRRQYLNLQQVTYKGKRMKICTSCLKKLYKV